MKPTDRFKTAMDYINAHEWASHVPQDLKDELALTCAKHRGIWAFRRTAPKDPHARTAWEAMRCAKHLKAWGYMPSYRSESMIWFFMKHPDQQGRFNDLMAKFEWLIELVWTVNKMRKAS